MKKFLSREDNVLMLNNGTIQQVVVTDVTITCPMTFTSFPFDTQSCPFEILDVERPPLDFFRMVTSQIQFSDWPRPFSPTASEFEYQVFWAKPHSRELITFWYWCQFFRFPTYLMIRILIRMWDGIHLLLGSPSICKESHLNMSLFTSFQRVSLFISNKIAFTWMDGPTIFRNVCSDFFDEFSHPSHK